MLARRPRQHAKPATTVVLPTETFVRARGCVPDGKESKRPAGDRRVVVACERDQEAWHRRLGIRVGVCRAASSSAASSGSGRCLGLGGGLVLGRLRPRRRLGDRLDGSAPLRRPPRRPARDFGSSARRPRRSASASATVSATASIGSASASAASVGDGLGDSAQPRRRPRLGSRLGGSARRRPRRRPRLELGLGLGDGLDASRLGLGAASASATSASATASTLGSAVGRRRPPRSASSSATVSASASEASGSASASTSATRRRPRAPSIRVVLGGSSTSAAATCSRTWAKADGERVVDAALGLLDRVRQRVTPARRGRRSRAAPLACAGRRGRAGFRRGAGRRLLGLLEAEAQAMALGVERDDLELEVWPSWTTSPGWATRWWDSSLMWIRPSRPSRTRTKAPKLTSFVTVPSMTSPTLKSATVECHGSGWRRRIDRLIRPRSWLMSMTSASTSSPTL